MQGRADTVKSALMMGRGMCVIHRLHSAWVHARTARTHPQLVGFFKKESNGYIVDVFAV